MCLCAFPLARLFVSVCAFACAHVVKTFSEPHYHISVRTEEAVNGDGGGGRGGGGRGGEAGGSRGGGSGEEEEEVEEEAEEVSEEASVAPSRGLERIYETKTNEHHRHT